MLARVESGELDTALAFLSFARHCVLKKAGGLGPGPGSRHGRAGRPRRR